MANLEKEIAELDLNAIHISSMPYKQVYNFLLNESQLNETLNSRIQNQDKNFSDCMKYLYTSVKKLLKGKSGYLEDAVVYNLSVEYYTTDIEIQPEEKISTYYKEKNNHIGQQTKTYQPPEEVYSEQSLF